MDQAGREDTRSIWYRRSSSQRSCGIRYPGLYPAIPSSLRLFHLHNYSTNTNTHSGSKLLGINEFIDLRRMRQYWPAGDPGWTVIAVSVVPTAWLLIA